MTRVAAAALLLALVVAPAAAQAPTGFTEFAWGTNPSVLREQVVTKRCQSSTESRRGWYSILCREYLIEGLSVPALRLDFEPADALAGYHMVVARGSYSAFRELVLKRFGRPTTRRLIPLIGQQMWWTWPGVSATLIEKCGEESSCLEVTTATLDRRRDAIRERERRDATQSF
jgi:hypothetical protein